VGQFGMEARTKEFLFSGRRDKIEIMAATIALAQKPTSMTRMISLLKLSHVTLAEYLQLMVERRLIKKHRPTKTAKKTAYVYHATEKGLLFLKKYHDALKVLYEKDYGKQESMT